MKEFKFWALICPMKQLLMFVIPVWIIFVIFFFSVDVFEYFGYFFAAILIFNIFFFVFFFKYVKITFSHSNEIRIYFNGKEKYIGNADSLKYAKGADLNNDPSYGELGIIFADRNFFFRISEKRGLFESKPTKHVALLRYMATAYQLEKESSQSTLFGESFIYSNPQYKGISVNERYNKSEY
ncbi:hypothetical protein JGH11_17930 [Dysgonomonas sp. Marseille-P4677]|nr:hypothetical protein [Dysgonomonas sp. Marseille-P4677]